MNIAGLTRRSFLKTGAWATAVAVGITSSARKAEACLACITDKLDGSYPVGETKMVGNLVVPASADGIPEARTYQPAPEGQMDPMRFLTTFDEGEVTIMADGRTKREYFIRAEDKELEVAEGITFPAWTYNGFMPGPTLRAKVGDQIVIHFENQAEMPHTIHFHGIHPANMDGVFEIVPKGKSFIYEFTAVPFGVFPYHCHVMPLRKHVARGLYGTLIVDPPEPRPPAREMIMVMHGLDVNMDMANEFYAVNGYANYYAEHPIEIQMGEKVRIYLSNMTEFDLVNNFHLHANMFNYYPNGTTLEPSEYTDVVNLCQGQRGIIEFTYDYPGMFMFHAHTAEFAELGWLGFFYVKEGTSEIA
jgi:FtsP/CotA-like multicopper oxidase with cupredoxin domain